MVLDQLGETPHLGIQARPLRHRPARQRLADLQPEIVVQPPGVMLLDDEDRLLAARRAAFRLGRGGEPSFGAIGVDGAGHVGRTGPAEELWRAHNGV